MAPFLTATSVTGSCYWQPTADSLLPVSPGVTTVTGMLLVLPCVPECYWYSWITLVILGVSIGTVTVTNVLESC